MDRALAISTVIDKIKQGQLISAKSADELPPDAEAVLRDKANPTDQTRLADAYLARLNEVAAEGAGPVQEKQA